MKGKMEDEGEDGGEVEWEDGGDEVEDGGDEGEDAGGGCRRRWLKGRIGGGGGVKGRMGVVCLTKNIPLTT